MRITAQDLMDLRVIDEIIPEPIGGAHRDKTVTIDRAGAAIQQSLDLLTRLSPDDLRAQRSERFMQMGRGL
jgi:acetyl-CoA carboxylase carboxyl transferase subunit alpha